MSAISEHSQRKIVEYDALRKRLWIFGQRCHHGATGSLVAALACARLITDSAIRRDVHKGIPSVIAMAAAGGVLMAHDWKDHNFWFELGHGTQP